MTFKNKERIEKDNSVTKNKPSTEFSSHQRLSIADHEYAQPLTSFPNQGQYGLPTKKSGFRFAKLREIEVWIDNGENGREVSGGEVSEREFSGEETDGEFDCDDKLEEEARIDDIAFDKAVDPTVEFQGVGSSANVQDKENQCVVNEEVNFSDEGTPHGSDEEVEDDIWPQFRACDMQCPQFTVGMTFGTKAEFKEAIVNYAFKDCKDLKFVRNDKIRFVAKCKQSDCPWYITLRKNENDNCWRISVFNDKHECSWGV
ncbi:uncharacterized protein LOC116027025 [Ipomoea triloba]|uniref:uncharacterized protein LOC116027025 n=1 Tax=Ipomoea triloba TaxID=35885 RepID=UPI00125D37D2|nr:uncharacterized protein LOC116027025 [Ipomoea triloba]